MIAIINCGPVGSYKDIDGLHTYTVGINCEVIADFEHVRSDGLAVCLEKAAAAVREMEAEK